MGSGVFLKSLRPGQPTAAFDRKWGVWRTMKVGALAENDGIEPRKFTKILRWVDILRHDDFEKTLRRWGFLLADLGCELQHLLERKEKQQQRANEDSPPHLLKICLCLIVLKLVPVLLSFEVV